MCLCMVHPRLTFVSCITKVEMSRTETHYGSFLYQHIFFYCQYMYSAKLSVRAKLQSTTSTLLLTSRGDCEKVISASLHRGVNARRFYLLVYFERWMREGSFCQFTSRGEWEKVQFASLHREVSARRFFLLVYIEGLMREGSICQFTSRGGCEKVLFASLHRGVNVRKFYLLVYMQG